MRPLSGSNHRSDGATGRIGLVTDSVLSVHRMKERTPYESNSGASLPGTERAESRLLQSAMHTLLTLANLTEYLWGGALMRGRLWRPI